MASVILGGVVFIRQIARIVGPSPLDGGPFVRDLSSFLSRVGAPGKYPSLSKSVIRKYDDLTPRGEVL